MVVTSEARWSVAAVIITMTPIGASTSNNMF